jgi:hypothetical protein
MADHHTIVVQHEIFGAAVEVLVKPTPTGIGHDREFRSLSEARHYAAELSAATGWRIADLVEGGDA